MFDAAQMDYVEESLREAELPVGLPTRIGGKS